MLPLALGLGPATCAVRFFMPFENFGASALPRDVDEYRTFRTNSIEFITARNRRIDALGL